MPNPFPVDHDLHTHTFISECSPDEELTAISTLAFGKQHGYVRIAITDHLWDAAVPGASNWYAPQDLDHISKILPLPQDDSVEMLFGCETEYCGGSKLGIAPEHFHLFKMIAIPVNHFHMRGFVRPVDCDTPEKLAELLTSRLEELCALTLPWGKIGLAHLNGCDLNALRIAPDARLRAVFRFLSNKGAGIELNAACFPPGWRHNEDAHLKLFRIALDEHCTFYCSSDSHTREDLNRIPDRMREVVDVLGLDSSALFIPSSLK